MKSTLRTFGAAIFTIGLTSLLLACTAKLSEIQSPAREFSVVAEGVETIPVVETIPISSRRNRKTSSNTAQSCTQQGSVLRCTAVSRDALEHRFDELQRANSY